MHASHSTGHIRRYCARIALVCEVQNATLPEAHTGGSCWPVHANGVVVVEVVVVVVVVEVVHVRHSTGHSGRTIAATPGSDSVAASHSATPNVWQSAGSATPLQYAVDDVLVEELVVLVVVVVVVVVVVAVVVVVVVAWL